MEDKRIKTGDQIVAEFVTNIELSPDVDMSCVKAIQELYASDSLTNTKLIQALAELRAVALKDLRAER